MSCDRYWREGIVLVERDQPDPHREHCEDCARAHAAREELVQALPLVGATTSSDQRWQARVWAEIARTERRTGSRRTWILAGAIAALCVLVAVLGVRRMWSADAEPAYVTVVTIEKGPIQKRGDAQVGDRIHTQLSPSDEVRIYRSSRLVFRCPSRQARRDCARDSRGSVATYELAAAGEYTVVIIATTAVEPRGSLDSDLAALVQANASFRIERELSVR